MATLLLSAAGAAFGAGFGGTVLGLSGAVIGRAIGATLGRAIDQRVLGGGSEAVEVGRLDRLRLNGAGEGAAIARLWGRMRLSGHVIWASQFEEHSESRGGGKGAPTISEFSYTVSLAIGLCEGEILKIGRVWADGTEVAPHSLNLRLYRGTEDQLPDALLEATEGAGRVPAFRGLAYVVLEDLDLSIFGNRVPQFSFEVVRNAQGTALGDEKVLSDVVPAVAMIPGTGEYALATTAVHMSYGLGENVALNTNSPAGVTDFCSSLEQLTQELPQCTSVSLVVSWFGSDLRCGQCEIRAKVEQSVFDGQGMPWRAGGITRGAASIVARRAGRPIYGGTPADASVIEAIRAIRAEGREVMFYPFILMEQLAHNGLSDPWTGAPDQPVLPWRGRITGEIAPGRPGNPDGTLAIDAQVQAFFGTAEPEDFGQSGEEIFYTGPAEWRYRRFILHYAALCRAAGGVDAFCIGSEMPGLTRLRNHQGAFPAVSALMQLAGEVRAILGPQTKISYAADWTEYGGYAQGEDLWFPLDPLWADPAVDFIGIDNYMPLSDWRDSSEHADAGWGSIYNLAYLRANIAGGEYFDWYYDSPEGEAAGNRLPITDGTWGEPWVYRVKDLRGWWANSHHPRQAGVRSAAPTPWVPGSKPIRFTEYGCAAIDKGTNHPNRFLDRHSSESAQPRASTGQRDDLIQMQYLRAMAEHWRDPDQNPQATLYQGRMLDFSRAHVWAWDARPFPAFPGRSDLWADAEAYRRGHWLNGRATNQPLAAVIREICGATGLREVETGAAQQVVRGYLIDQVQSGRSSLQPLLQAFGADAFDRDGKVQFALRRPGLDHQLRAETYAVDDLQGLAEVQRAPELETGVAVRLSHVEADGNYEIRMAEIRQPDESQATVAGTELALALTGPEAKGICARWLGEARIARDGLRLSLAPSRLEVGAGDRVATPDGSVWRVDRVEQAEARRIEATRIEGGAYEPSEFETEPMALTRFVAPVPVWPLFLDLPLLRGDEVPHQPHVAVSARPWPGAVALWAGDEAAGFALNRLIARPAIMGVTESGLDLARPGVWDRGTPLRIKLALGALSSASSLRVLNGANVMAIGDGSAGNWEVFQFCDAELVAPRTWDVAMRLRGQAGTDGLMPAVWPAGSLVVLLDAATVQVEIAASLRGLSREYRLGVLGRGYDDPAVVALNSAFDGNGLRPLPVAHLHAKGRAGQDLRVSWVRRGRIEADNWQQIDIPLGEEVESYLIRIMAGETILGSYATAQARFDYTAAMQAADGVSAGFDVAVAQISARYGPGLFRKTSVVP